MVFSFQHLRLECTIRAALHQRCEAVGVDAVRQGVWKQPVYKTHLDKGQLGGTTQNRGAPEKDVSASRVGS